jgi:acyl dehydratase
VSDLIYFEDVRIGQTHRFGHYVVTAEEIVEYARQFDPQSFHVDGRRRSRACSAVSSRVAGTRARCSSA